MKELENSYGDIKYSRRNIANNMVITMYGASWVLEMIRENTL